MSDRLYRILYPVSMAVALVGVALWVVCPGGGPNAAPPEPQKSKDHRYDPWESYWGRLPQEIEISGYARVFNRPDYHDRCWLEINHTPYGNQSGSYWLHGCAYPIDTQDNGWAVRRWHDLKDRRVWVRGTLVVAKRPWDDKPDKVLIPDQIRLFHESISLAE